MNILKDITKLVYRYGDKDESYRISIPNVYVNYGVTDINLFIEDSIPKIQFPLGMTYKLTALTNVELYSILNSVEKFFNEC